MVAGWEELITPLELTLELYDQRSNIDRSTVSTILNNKYKPSAGNPERITILSDPEIESLVTYCCGKTLDKEFLETAYKAVKDYRAEQVK